MTVTHIPWAALSAAEPNFMISNPAQSLSEAMKRQPTAQSYRTFLRLPLDARSCHTAFMISVIIPTLNAAATLPATLESLIPAAVQGLVREVLVVDGGSTDATLKIADGFGAVTISGGPLRANRLTVGAQLARFPWLLFIDPDCALDPGWEREAGHLIGKVEDGNRSPTAAVFRFALDDSGIEPRATERLARWSAALLGLAHAEQGLLIPRTLYAEVGGFKPYPLLEDVDLSRRVGRRRLMTFRSTAVSNANRFRQQGYFGRALRYYGCLGLYTLNVPMERIASLLGPPPQQAPGV
jgi:glycosyltransferase involved in cell wall biosynthesis